MDSAEPVRERYLCNMKLTMHIGARIKEVLESMPKEYTITWFASQIHCDRRNVYYIFERPTIDTGLLQLISEVVNHNFFRDLADDFDSAIPSEGDIGDEVER